MKVTLYVLEGAWNSTSQAGCKVLGVSVEIEPMKEILEEIADSRAKEYLVAPYGEIEEDRGERHYEIADEDGNWAKFYVTEHDLELDESIGKGYVTEADGECRPCAATNWQSSETYLEEPEDEEVAMCKCGNLYWHFKGAVCPYCGDKKEV